MHDHPIQVLLVDDDQDYYILIRDALSEIANQQYNLEWASTYHRAVEAITTKSYDICFLDYHLGEHTGLEVLGAAQAQGCKTPMIMLTGQSAHEVDLAAMRAGVADYLAKKEASATTLERSIRYAIERQRALEALRESERRIAELYRQEQERSQELAQAYADLRRVEGLRDDLTRMIIHDLRNPLTIVRTSLDMLAMSSKNPSIAQNAPTLIASARTAERRMIGMIDDLLHLSKLEAGELQLSLMPLSPLTFLSKKVDSFQTQAERERKTLSLRVPAKMPTIFADVDLISRVLDNLIGNAFKYTGDGGLIEIGAEDKGAVLLFYVHDNGPGIPEEYHKRIFDKFVQMGSTSQAALHKGVGLGLAFCRLAVEAHGGQIWVESAPNEGSTFFFMLPVKQPETESDDTPPA
jgi:signal transduction histidine kinase